MASQLLLTLPDIEPISKDDMDTLLASVGVNTVGGAEGFNSDYLVMFTEDDSYEPEMRKLAPLLPSDLTVSTRSVVCIIHGVYRWSPLISVRRRGEHIAILFTLGRHR